MVRLLTYYQQRLAASRGWRMAVVVLGIIAGQAVLYGPCLVGNKLLLPLETLAQQGIYIPRTPALKEVRSFDDSLSDQIYFKEPLRRFSAAEFRAGRLPMWWPDQYAGAPYVLPKFSPFAILQAAVKSPVVLAWSALLCALVAGSGAYVFFRRVLKLGYLASAIGANCYPLSGFLVLWSGFGLELSVCWLPWLLWSVDGTIRNRSRWSPLLLAIATFLTLASGQLDVGAQVLMISGLFGIWVGWDEHRRQWLSRAAAAGLGRLAAAWLLGILLAAPHVLPLLEYAHTGSRLEKRTAGIEERPPVGLAALPMLVLPDQYGRSTRGSVLTLPFGPGNIQESAAAGYAGLVAVLVAVPLAFGCQRHRRMNFLLAGLVLLGASWALDLPVFVDLLRLPGLNTMSHNRLVFATGFGLLALAMIGLQRVAENQPTAKAAAGLPALVAVGLGGWCLYRVAAPAEAIHETLPGMIEAGNQVFWLRGMADVRQVTDWYARHFYFAAALGGAAAAWWLCLWLRPHWRSVRTGMLAMLMLGDLLWFAHGRYPQSDPALYYPEVPALAEIGRAAGRVVGFNCLPADLASVAGLRDVRGCDGVDPKELVELLALTTTIPSPYEYAVAQLLVPTTVVTPSGTAKLHPILDMLGVRYVILREPPPREARPVYQSEDYWVLENTNALPRIFVPRTVECIADKATRLGRMGENFDASATCLLEVPVAPSTNCRGRIEIVQEQPTRIQAVATMEREGVVVLADRWDAGWKAYCNGTETRLLRANHAVRGVVVPAGEWRLEFRYEPRSFRSGLWLAGTGATALGLWFTIGEWRRRIRTPLDRSFPIHA